jgi:hypothetical protein
MEFYGLLPEEGEHQFDYCGDPNQYQQVSDCTNYLMDSDALTSYFEESCQDQSSCRLNMLEYLLQDPDSDSFK